MNFFWSHTRPTRNIDGVVGEKYSNLIVSSDLLFFWEFHWFIDQLLPMFGPTQKETRLKRFGFRSLIVFKNPDPWGGESSRAHTRGWYMHSPATGGLTMGKIFMNIFNVHLALSILRVLSLFYGWFHPMACYKIRVCLVAARTRFRTN
jgi:hypothetical protein